MDPHVCDASRVWKPCLENQATQDGLCIPAHSFFTTVLKSSSIKPTGNWCGKKSLTKTSEFAVHSERPEAPMKSC